MNTFIHTADGRIIINNNEFPLATFQTYEPAYTLGAVYEERIYLQGLSHTVLDSDNSTYVTLPSVWVEGDNYIANLSTYLSSTLTDTLENLIDRYESLLDTGSYTDISDPNFIEEYRLEVLVEALELNNFEKITFANRFPEFKTLSTVLTTPAVNTVLYKILLKSDWTQLSDSGLSAGDRTAWDSYRSSLRALYGVPVTNILNFNLPLTTLDYKDRG
jgi:hypothetical protein